MTLIIRVVLFIYHLIFKMSYNLTSLIDILFLSLLKGAIVLKEYEKKVLLNKEEYYFLLNRFKAKVLPDIQINYYYDTDNLAFAKSDITCRIREKNGEYIATVKSHKSKFNIENSKKVNRQWDTSFFDFCTLKYWGNLVTLRYKIKVCKEVEICLDQNIYLDDVDYELEVEYAEGNETVAETQLSCIVDALENADIINSRSEFARRINKGDSKSKRFFKKRAKTGDKL